MTEVSTAPAVTALLADFSLEMTGKDTATLASARATIPPGTRINITFLGTEDAATRLAAARAVTRLGFVPVPHIAARRLRSAAELDEFLAALHAIGASEHVFVVGGDPAVPHGPYPDALSVLESGLLQRHGVREVGLGGYPEGHPAIAESALWSALSAKVAALSEANLAGNVITQFGFAVEPVLDWVAAVRDRGVTLPIRVGVPGPAGVRRLLGYAARFGVGTSASIAKKYGFAITNLMGTAGPDRFLRDLAARHDAGRHGDLALHFYTFGGLPNTSAWVADFLASEGS